MISRKIKLFLAVIVIAVFVILYENIELETKQIRKNHFMVSSLNNNEDKFQLSKSLLVFLHIQKTGGSEFDRKIVQNLLVYDKQSDKWKRACEDVPSWRLEEFKKLGIKYRKLICPRTNDKDNIKSWYISRQTIGWSCGLHADFTRLTNCVNERFVNKVHNDVRMFTILRDPMKRFISEWRHIKQGATWRTSKNLCNPEDRLKECFKTGFNLSLITLNQFLSCEKNSAFNRQTRMLALYDERDNCELFKDENKEKLLENAKRNLENLSFFALTEYQRESQMLFEKTFDGVLKFANNLEQSDSELSTQILKGLDKEATDAIRNANDLDIKLYEHALKLFNSRLHFYKINLN